MTVGWERHQLARPWTQSREVKPLRPGLLFTVLVVCLGGPGLGYISWKTRIRSAPRSRALHDARHWRQLLGSQCCVTKRDSQCYVPPEAGVTLVGSGVRSFTASSRPNYDSWRKRHKTFIQRTVVLAEYLARNGQKVGPRIEGY